MVNVLEERVKESVELNGQDLKIIENGGKVRCYVCEGFLKEVKDEEDNKYMDFEILEYSCKKGHNHFFTDD